MTQTVNRSIGINAIQMTSITLFTLAVIGGGIESSRAIAQSVPPAATPAETSLPFTVQGAASQTGADPALDAYVLGPGDRLNIVAFGAESYSGEVLVLPDGSIDLPTAGTIRVGGMTLQQANNAITAQYRGFIQRPVVTLSLVELRPVRVGIAGQVNRPGTYTISGGTSSGTSNEPNGGGASSSPFSTLTEAIQIAGGITPRADLRQVQVQRLQRDGSRRAINVNLWELLITGDMTKDILLQAGDAIVVPMATAVNPSETVQLGAASFSPDTIPVYVVGEVMTPGMVEVPPNTPLNQALLAAGGFNVRRARTSEVKLIRLNPDGTVSQNEVEIDFSQGAESASNPPLQKGDVIVVGRSGLASFSDGTEDILAPIGRILSGILGIFPLF